MVFYMYVCIYAWTCTVRSYHSHNRAIPSDRSLYVCMHVCMYEHVLIRSYDTHNHSFLCSGNGSSSVHVCMHEHVLCGPTTRTTLHSVAVCFQNAYTHTHTNKHLRTRLPTDFESLFSRSFMNTHTHTQTHTHTWGLVVHTNHHGFWISVFVFFLDFHQQQRKLCKCQGLHYPVVSVPNLLMLNMAFHHEYTCAHVQLRMMACCLRMYMYAQKCVSCVYTYARTDILALVVAYVYAFKRKSVHSWVWALSEHEWNTPSLGASCVLDIDLQVCILKEQIWKRIFKSKPEVRTSKCVYWKRKCKHKSVRANSK